MFSFDFLNKRYTNKIIYVIYVLSSGTCPEAVVVVE